MAIGLLLDVTARRMIVISHNTFLIPSGEIHSTRHVKSVIIAVIPCNMPMSVENLWNT